MPEQIIRLKPIIDETSEYDGLEKAIIEWFKKEIYLPILKPVNIPIKLSNSNYTFLQQALKSGRIYYENGNFKGTFNSRISKELRELGAKYDRKEQSYKIELNELPFEIRSEISLAKSSFDDKIVKIDYNLQNINIDTILGKLDISKFFDKSIFKVDKQFHENVKNITIAPKLTKDQRKKIADEWETNMKLYIKNFSEKQILELRQKVKDNVLKGNRRENLVKTFMDSYNVSENKAKFWARQETNLMMAKYQETRYVAAGITEYEWRCVHMPHQLSPNSVYKKGEVRYSHSILEGKIFSWNDPPVTTPPGQPQRRNNPKQDYNCRCFAIPVIRK